VCVSLSPEMLPYWMNAIVDARDLLCCTFFTVQDLIVTTLTADNMKTLVQEELIKVPRDVTITIKAKTVEVKGKHGTLKRNFKHLPLELWLANSNKEVRVRMYFAKSKQVSCIRSCCSHIQNMFEGVQKRYRYTMRMVYAHFPINAVIANGGKTIEIRNFLGEKMVRVVDMLPGVEIKKGTGAVKDELVIEGADIDYTSRSAALVRQSCLVKDKDIRKFLDGIYVSAHGVIED